MVGHRGDPGLMVRSMEALFEAAQQFEKEETVGISASYLEVYNEVEIPFLLHSGVSVSVLLARLRAFCLSVFGQEQPCCVYECSALQ